MMIVWGKLSYHDKTTVRIQYIMDLAENGFAEWAHITEHHHIKSGW